MAPKTTRTGPLVAEKRYFPEKSPKKKPAQKKKSAKKGGLFAFFSRPTRKTPKKKAKRGIFARIARFFIRFIWIVASRSTAMVAVVVGGATLAYLIQLPDAQVLMDDRQRGSVTMTDAEGAVFAWRGDQFGGLVTADTVSPHLKNAVIATEDKRFYSHLGISPRGMAGAIRTNLREGRSALSGHGGSTITQQVAKRVFFSDLNGLERKIKEVPMSFAMELKYSKDDILNIYMNRAYLGAGSFGFEAAAQRYFAKSARNVNAAEAAMLAGLLKAPSRFAPTRNMNRARDRAALIISLMEDQGYLTATQAEAAVQYPAELSEIAQKKAGGYFADWVMESAPEFLIKDTTEDVLIETTFDPRIQKAAEEALAQVFAEKVSKGSGAEAAIVIMSPDGAVRAMVGGRDTGTPGGFNRATQALRQTGSSFKPFVYAAALEAGFRQDSIVEDAPITIKTRGQPDWSPKNYTKEFKGAMSMTDAFAESINTVAVKLSEEVGRARVKALAQDFGITSTINPVPAMALGASESTLLEMTGAYAGILNAGHLAQPYGVDRITLQGEETPLMGKIGGTGHRVMTPDAAGQLIYMMNEVVARGTGGRAALPDREVAGKTGTTQGARDAWFIGFSADYVAGVWMGYDDNSKLSGVTGGGLPAEIWRETMLRVHDGLPINPLPMTRPGASKVDQLLAQINSTPNRAPAPSAPEAEARNIIENVLKNILGGGRF